MSQRYRRILLRTTIVIFLLLTTGCTTMTDPEGSQEYNSQTVGMLGPQQTLGQSFVSRRPRLNGITIWVSNANPGQKATLEAILSPAASSPNSLFSTTIEISPGSNSAPVYIQFPPQSRLPEETYYLELRSNSALYINGRGEDAYAPGQAYFNSQPIDADLAFRVTYDYDFAAALQDLQSWVSQSPQIISVLALLLLPGWLILDLLSIRRLFAISEQVVLAVGLSLSAIPVVMLWTSTLSLYWTTASVRMTAGGLLAIALLRAIHSHRERRSRNLKGTPAQSHTTGHQGPILSPRMTAAVLAVIFFLALAIRLAMVRDLATPAWVDSVHHALITRLIIDQGAFPTTYQPYLDIDPHNYHPGFHSFVAVLCWLTKLPIANALGLSGQILNALAVPAVFLLTHTLTKDTRAGLVAAFITAFLTPMPAYLTSWGRFTHLSGLVILPVLFTLTHKTSMVKPNYRLRIALVAGMVAAGLFLVHYRVLAFAILLIIAYAIIQIPIWLLRRNPSSKAFLLSLGTLGISATLLSTPWLIPFMQNILLPKLTPAVADTTSAFADFSWRFLSAAYGKQALALSTLGLIWALVQRKHFAATVTLWIAGLLLLANLRAVGLPGGGLVNNISVAISLFIPISLAAGFLISQWIEAWTKNLTRRVHPWFAACTLILAGIIALAGARQLLPILNPTTILTRNSDIAGLAWLDESIPIGETILINPFPWGYGIYAGQDGGFWISPLTGRPTIPPLVLSGMDNSPQTVQMIDFSQAVYTSAQDAQTIWALLKAQDIQYIYIGARGGVISPHTLSASDLYETLYAQNNVWVFKVLP